MLLFTTLTLSIENKVFRVNPLNSLIQVNSECSYEAKIPCKHSLWHNREILHEMAHHVPIQYSVEKVGPW